VDRIEIAQTVLDAIGGDTYLEIGVSTGMSFIPLRAKRKWGVDPDPHLSWKRLAKYRLFSLLHIGQEIIFRQTSDRFFKDHESILKRHGLDVGFVDGLHTYEQALRDVLNCLDYLRPHGVILMHDCNPADETTALPAAGIAAVAAKSDPGWTGDWCGDVWKAVVHLRSRDDLNVFVLDCDHGVGVVSRGGPAEKLAYSERDVQQMDYGRLAADRQRLLGLRPPEYLYEFLRSRGR
jgi:Methyltransferase domain